MNFLQRASKTVPTHSNRYFWSEIIALPIAIAAMEGIGVGLGIAFFSLALNTVVFPVTLLECFLFDLGLMWWGLSIANMRNTINTWKLFTIIGLLVALILIEHPWNLSISFTFENTFTVLFRAAVVTFFWQRNIQRSLQTVSYEDMRNIFRISIAAILGAVAVTAIGNFSSTIVSQIELSVFIFIVGTIYTLSLTRLSIIRDSHVKAEGDPTRIWIAFLTIFSILTIIGGLILDGIFSVDHVAGVMQLLQPAFQSTLNAIGAFIIWLLYIIGIIISPILYVVQVVIALFIFFISLFQSKPKKLHLPPIKKVFPRIPNPENPPAHTAVAVVFVIIVVIIAVIFIIQAIRKFNVHAHDNEMVEIRENLNWRTLFQRRNRNMRVQKHQMESLDSQSARVRYREILIAAEDSRILPRNIDETPQEYEQRVQQYLQTTDMTDMQEMSEDLARITTLYRKERYGNATIQQAERAQLSTLVPQFIHRLFGKQPGKM